MEELQGPPGLSIDPEEMVTDLAAVTMPRRLWQELQEKSDSRHITINVR